MNPSHGDFGHSRPWEEREIDAARTEASRIGGYAGDEHLDPAQRPLVEAGEGVAEGFELAEEDLIRSRRNRRGLGSDTASVRARG